MHLSSHGYDSLQCASQCISLVPLVVKFYDKCQVGLGVRVCCVVCCGVMWVWVCVEFFDDECLAAICLLLLCFLFVCLFVCLFVLFCLFEFVI